ncbi:MAG: hypothetical protein ACTSO7_17315 [Candidatus Heimdallarchaeota archaeon]
MKWLQAKSETKGIEFLKEASQVMIVSGGKINPGFLQKLAKTIIKVGERDGELGIQALLFQLIKAEKINQKNIPQVYSALDLVASNLGYDNRNELMTFFRVPDVNNKTVYDPIADKTFDDKIEEVYSAVLNTIQKVRPGIQVTLPRLAELSKAPKKFVEDVILTILERKPVLGEYLQFEQVFIRKEDTEEIIDELIINPIQRFSHLHCSNCQEIIKDRSVNACPSCGEAISRCVVCKLPIGSDDAIGQCSKCEGIAHLSHLQEWVKTQGKCPRCQQTTEIIIIREAEQEIEEALAFGIKLTGIQIVNLGEWRDVPEGSEMTDAQGFFNMLNATSEKKLNQWRKNSDYNFIGFFEQGKFFYFALKKFDSIKEYLIALNYGFQTPEQLMLHRRALKQGWENFKIMNTVWKAIFKNNYVGIPIDFTYHGGESRFSYRSQLLKHQFIDEKYREILSSIPKRGKNFEMLPPFDNDIIFGEDWFVWLLAFHNSWKSFEDLNDFAKEVFPEFETRYEEWIKEAQALLKIKTKDGSFNYDFELNRNIGKLRANLNPQAKKELQYLIETTFTELTAIELKDLEVKRVYFSLDSLRPEDERCYE